MADSSSALDNPVKNFTLAKGFYYKLYDDCDEQMREKFEEINGFPGILVSVCPSDYWLR
jgi:hypothetical protein